MIWFLISSLVVVFCRRQYLKEKLAFDTKFAHRVLDPSESWIKDDAIESLANSKRILVTASFLTIATAIYFGAWMPVKAEKLSNDNRQAYYAGFAKGWDYECKEIFNGISNSGVLYDGGSSFDIDWCNSLNNQDEVDLAYSKSPRDFSNTKDANGYGQGAAVYRVVTKVFENHRSLCYGDNCTTYADEEKYLMNLFEQGNNG